MVNTAAINTLLNYGIHPSIQRIAIMDYLLKHHTHPTVDEVYTALSDEIPTLSKTTVYNTLRLFSEHGAAKMLTIDERKICFDGNIKPHSHFLCRCCGKIYDFPLPTSDDFLIPDKAKQFQVEEIHFYYKGVCEKCNKKSQCE